MNRVMIHEILLIIYSLLHCVFNNIKEKCLSFNGVNDVFMILWNSGALMGAEFFFLSLDLD